MGYTHYYNRPKELDKSTFALFVADAKKIVAAVEKRGIKLGNWDGKASPSLTNSKVSLNGVGEDAHESFIIPRVFKPSEWQKPHDDGNYFDFCKTARKPYDLAVASILLAFKHHFGGVVKVSSDGWYESTQSHEVEQDQEWNDAIALYREILGYDDEWGYDVEGGNIIKKTMVTV